MTVSYWQHADKVLKASRFSGHSWLTWLGAAALAMAVFIVLKTVRRLGDRALVAASAHTERGWPRLLRRAVLKTSPWFLALVAILVASAPLALSPLTRAALIDIGTTALFLQVARWGHAMITAGIDHYRGHSTDSERVTVVVAAGLVATILLWTLLTLAALNNLGINVTALLAGFGVGGVALALAIQTTLADVLASFSIVFDKPFVLGDNIALDAYTGTVEHIGLKTTHLRSPSGEQIIIPNSDLVKGRVRNYKRMQNRTVTSTLYLTYENPPESVALAARVVEEVIRREGRACFLGTCFTDYQPQGLVLEIRYMIPKDYADAYKDIQQTINIGIFRAFHEQGIEFARQVTAHADWSPQPPAKEAR